MRTSPEQSPSKIPKPACIKQGDVLSLSNQGQLELLQAVLAKGVPFRMPVRGQSMQPLIQDRDVLVVEPLVGEIPRLGDVVAFTTVNPERLVVHRVIGRRDEGWRLRGDNCKIEDHLVDTKNILGRVIAISRNGKPLRFGLGLERALIALLNRGQAWMRLKSLPLAFKRASSRLIEMLQTWPTYRKIVKIKLPTYQIVEAQPSELPPVYRKLYQAGVPYEHESGQVAWEFLAQSRGRVIGYVKYVQVGKPKTHWIAALYVFPRFRGMGIGEALVSHVIRLAGEEEARTLFCSPRQHETRILALLRKLGFHDVGKHAPKLQHRLDLHPRYSDRITFGLHIKKSDGKGKDD